MGAVEASLSAADPSITLFSLTWWTQHFLPWKKCESWRPLAKGGDRSWRSQSISTWGVTLVGDDVGDNVLGGGQFSDTVIGGSSHDGLAVSNTLHGNGGNDIVTGGRSFPGGGLFDGSVYNDLYGDNGDDLITGGEAVGGTAHNRAYGGHGDDTILGGSVGAGGLVINELYGEKGDDNLTGGSSQSRSRVDNLLDGGDGRQGHVDRRRRQQRPR